MYYKCNTMLSHYQLTQINMAEDIRPRKKKEKSIGARVSTEMFMEINAYLDTLEMSMGQLVRQALSEYMGSHPLKVVQEIKNRKGN